MTRLLLVPHAQTDWSANRRYQGQTDIPLDESGRIQAAGLARHLESETLDAIFASDLSRARETALLCAAPHGLPVRAEPRLRELNFGQWEGKTYAEVERTEAELLAAWQRGGMDRRPPGGESLASLADRVRSFFQELVDGKHPAALLVAHRGSLRVLLCLALGLTPLLHWRFHLNPASISRLALLPEGGAVLTCLNDTHHLSEVVHAG